jgi:hypothetical protein
MSALNSDSVTNRKEQCNSDEDWPHASPVYFAEPKNLSLKMQKQATNVKSCRVCPHQGTAAFQFCMETISCPFEQFCMLTILLSCCERHPTDSQTLRVNIY